MNIRLLNFGFLKVRASEMIRGVVPGRIREYYAVDEEGNMKIAMNSLLIEHGGRVVLIDPGCGDFLPKRVLDEYGLEIPVPPEALLQRAGYKETDVTDVVFTHLHFDHGTAAFRRVPGKMVKRYERARYHVSEIHYRYALKPASPEKNSFFTFVFRTMDEIHMLEQWDSEWMEFLSYNGHTRSMAVPRVTGKDADLVFASDLLPLRLLTEPGSTSAYDMEPGIQVEEKKNFLESIIRPTLVVLYHDPHDPVVLLKGGDMTADR
ncbi:MAG: MBL fold metallo-hydrolase, partial [Bacteroidales bacterium]|nr:MBL fold metallo-hydrolase [Bacteroidales bacterium]